MWRWIIVALISVAVAFAFVGCEGKKEEPKKDEAKKPVEPPKPPEPPKPEPKPFDPVGKWMGKTAEGKDWSVEFVKDAKDANLLVAKEKDIKDIKVEGNKITFMKAKVQYDGEWDGIKECLTLKWKEKDKELSIELKKEAAPAPTTEPVKKEEPKKEEPKKK